MKQKYENLYLLQSRAKYKKIKRKYKSKRIERKIDRANKL